MKILGDNGVGCFVVKNVGLEKSKGARMYFPEKLAGEDLSTIPVKSGDGILITAIHTAVQESYSQLPCFNDSIHSYFFGSMPGSIRVSMLVFLGPRSSDGGSTPDSRTAGSYIKRLFRLYEENRPSRSYAKVVVHFPGNSMYNGVSMEGYLVGMSTETKDADVGLQIATFEFVTTTPMGVK